MKKLLAVIGAVFLILVLLIGGFLGFTLYTGQALDQSSKAYIEEGLTPIISTWDVQEVIKRASPQFMEFDSTNPGQLDVMFHSLKELGEYISREELKGQANINLDIKSGKLVTADYETTAKFKKGNVVIKIKLIQVSGEWRILFLNITP